MLKRGDLWVAPFFYFRKAQPAPAARSAVPRNREASSRAQPRDLSNNKPQCEAAIFLGYARNKCLWR